MSRSFCLLCWSLALLATAMAQSEDGQARRQRPATTQATSQEASQPGSTTTPAEGSETPPATFFERESLTGDWGGLRSRLHDRGISLTPIYQGEIFGNTGGARQGFIFDGLFNVALDLDLEKLTGFWKDATIHSNFLYVHGPNLSARYIGDFSTTSNIAGYNTPRLQELWLEQNFFDKRFSIRAGLLAGDTEFFTSTSAGLFIDSTFGAFNLIGSNFQDSPIYPVANPAVRFYFAPTPTFYARAAVFGMDSSSDPEENNRHGTHIHVNDADGALFMGEIGYLLNQAPDDHGLVGSYKVGGFAQRGDYATFASQARDALGTGSLSGKGTNYVVYAVVDQEIYKTEDRAISAFARGGFAPGRLSFVDRYFDVGFNFTGFIPTRSKDVAGLGFAYSHVSDDFSEAQVAQGEPPSSYEAVLEATYKIVLAPWWSVQPDVQYLFNPSGIEHSRDAWAFGLRTTVAF